MIPGLPRSPALCEMDESDIPPPVSQLSAIFILCEGKYCKFPDRIIPDGVQREEVLVGGKKVTLCLHCVRALGAPVNGRSALFGNNAMYRNGFHYL